MNCVTMIGRLTKDPEVRYTDKNLAIARFSIAVNRKFNKDETDFFDVTAFGKTGELVEKYVKKGSKIGIVGRLQMDSYENKNGDKVKAVKIIADEIEFLDSKREDPPKEEPPKSDESFMDIPDNIADDLPFK